MIHDATFDQELLVAGDALLFLLLTLLMYSLYLSSQLILNPLMVSHDLHAFLLLSDEMQSEAEEKILIHCHH
jgi:hypothetical protein